VQTGHQTSINRLSAIYIRNIQFSSLKNNMDYGGHFERPNYLIFFTKWVELCFLNYIHLDWSKTKKTQTESRKVYWTNIVSLAEAASSSRSNTRSSWNMRSASSSILCRALSTCNYKTSSLQIRSWMIKPFQSTLELDISSSIELDISSSIGRLEQ